MHYLYEDRLTRTKAGNTTENTFGEREGDDSSPALKETNQSTILH
jgi:hypothetical protein